MNNPSREEKFIYCATKCKHFSGTKCRFLKCNSCWNSIINSRYGKCPENNWTVDMPYIQEQTLPISKD